MFVSNGPLLRELQPTEVAFGMKRFLELSEIIREREKTGEWSVFLQFVTTYNSGSNQEREFSGLV